MPHILVTDDEARIRDVVEYALRREGYDVSTAAGGDEALVRIRAGGIDLLVLDVLMPDLDGLTLCRRLRADPTTAAVPIIFLSSRGEELDRVLGLENGADDYLGKPFSPRELVARIRSVLRRVTPEGEAIVHGPLELDLRRHELRVRGERVPLTLLELSLLRALLERPGRPQTRSQLIRRAWADHIHVTERTVDTHVKRIRAKLRRNGVDAIETVHGLGYRAADLP